MTIHSTILKTKIGIQDVISPYSLDQFFDFKCSSNAETVKNVKKSIDSQIVVSRQFDFTKKSKGEFPSQRTFGFIEDFGRNRRMNGLITING